MSVSWQCFIDSNNFQCSIFFANIIVIVQISVPFHLLISAQAKAQKGVTLNYVVPASTSLIINTKHSPFPNIATYDYNSLPRLEVVANLFHFPFNQFVPSSLSSNILQETESRDRDLLHLPSFETVQLEPILPVEESAESTSFTSPSIKSKTRGLDIAGTRDQSKLGPEIRTITRKGPDADIDLSRFKVYEAVPNYIFQ